MPAPSTHSDKAAERGEPSYVWRAGQDRRLAMIAAATPRLSQPPPARVLENGCGLGAYIGPLRRFTPDVHGLEYEFDRAVQAGRSHPPSLVVCAAGEQLPYPAASFDVILSNEVLEHVQDDRAAIVEMVRALRPGGRILLFCPNRWYPVEQHGIYWRGRYIFGNIPLVNYLPNVLRNRLAPHVRAYTAHGLRRLFTGLPVRIIEHRRIFGGYDNLVRRLGGVGRFIRWALHAAERTPLSVLGLSHFLVVETILFSSLTLTTRVADLDPRRHVNNRVYEQLCAEGRHHLLAAHGYPVERLLDEGLAQRPAATYVKFLRQQKAGAALTIETSAYSLGEGRLLWDHQLRQADGQAACRLQAQTQTLDPHGQPRDLLPAAADTPPPVLIETVPPFAGGCDRITSASAASHTDLDVFGRIPFAAGWRLFEEARHLFAEQLGLTPERLEALDTALFWGGGTYQFYQPLRPGQPLRTHTWLERVVRVRAYIRQEIWTAEGHTLLGASREEHIMVALKTTRPKAAPPELLDRLRPYLEHPA